MKVWRRSDGVESQLPLSARLEAPSAGRCGRGCWQARASGGSTAVRRARRCPPLAPPVPPPHCTRAAPRAAQAELWIRPGPARPGPTDPVLGRVGTVCGRALPPTVWWPYGLASSVCGEAGPGRASCGPAGAGLRGPPPRGRPPPPGGRRRPCGLRLPWRAASLRDRGGGRLGRRRAGRAMGPRPDGGASPLGGRPSPCPAWR